MNAYGVKFDPELTKDITFDDVVEQRSLPLTAFCNMSYDEDEKDTDQLLLYSNVSNLQRNVAGEPSQQCKPGHSDCTRGKREEPA